MAPLFKISSQALHDALQVVDFSLSEKGMRASARREDRLSDFGEYKPFHVEVTGLPSGRAMAAAELIINAHIHANHCGDYHQPFMFHPPSLSSNPKDARTQSAWFCGYSWNGRNKSLTFDLPDEWCDERVLTSVKKKLKEWKKHVSAEISTEPEPQTLYIVAGAGRSIGHHYMEQFKNAKAPHYCLGISRRDDDMKWVLESFKKPDILWGNIGQPSEEEYLYEMLQNTITRHIPPGPLRVVLLYTIGPFQFQGHPEFGDKATIPNDNVYALNFTAFRDLSGIIEDITEQRKSYYGDHTRLDLVGLSTKALVRDDSELFPAYSISKLNMEKYIQHFAEKRSGGIQRAGLVLRTSTLATPSEQEMRPGADAGDKKYWINPQELAAMTSSAILNMVGGNYSCLDVYKEKPDYSLTTMHKLEPAHQKWRKELKITDENDPAGMETDPIGGDPSLHQTWQSIRRKQPPKKSDGTISWTPDDMPPQPRDRT